MISVPVSKQFMWRRAARSTSGNMWGIMLRCVGSDYQCFRQKCRISLHSGASACDFRQNLSREDIRWNWGVRSAHFRRALQIPWFCSSSSLVKVLFGGFRMNIRNFLPSGGFWVIYTQVAVFDQFYIYIAWGRAKRSKRRKRSARPPLTPRNRRNWPNLKIGVE